MDKDEKAEQRKEIGKRLAIARKARKKTQEEVAAMLGKQQTDLSKFENGLGAPLEIYIGFAENLHISLDWLLTGKGTMENGRKEKTLEEMTVKNVGTALAALLTVTDMNESPLYSLRSEHGIAIDMLPRKYEYRNIQNPPVVIDPFLEKCEPHPFEKRDRLEDKRGAILCAFLSRLIQIRRRIYLNDFISSGEESYRKDIDALLGDLPNLPLNPIPNAILRNVSNKYSTNQNTVYCEIREI